LRKRKSLGGKKRAKKSKKRHLERRLEIEKILQVQQKKKGTAFKKEGGGNCPTEKNAFLTHYADATAQGGRTSG